jgi:hypothetical protein
MSVIVFLHASFLGCEDAKIYMYVIRKKADMVCRPISDEYATLAN